MRTPIRRNKLVDLTPLLDVFVILLFALLFNMSQETKASEKEVESLEESVERLEVSLDNALENNNELEGENLTLKNNIDKISEQQSKTNEAIMEWMSSKELVDNQIITRVMMEELFEKEQAKQRLYELEFIANQFFFIEIHVDTMNHHHVYINGEPTYVYLDLEIHENEVSQENAYNELIDQLEKLMTEAESGYNNVIFTLKDDGTTLAKSFNFIWLLLKDIEMKYGTDEIYKIQYLTY